MTSIYQAPTVYQVLLDTEDAAGSEIHWASYLRKHIT